MVFMFMLSCDGFAFGPDGLVPLGGLCGTEGTGVELATGPWFCFPLVLGELPAELPDPAAVAAAAPRVGPFCTASLKASLSRSLGGFIFASSSFS